VGRDEYTRVKKLLKLYREIKAELAELDKLEDYS
jgi:hypothetical protein